MDKTLDFYQHLTRLIEAGEPCVSAILADITGSAPQQQGARVLITREGLYWGTIGGGKIEARVIAEGQAMLTEHCRYRFYAWNLQTEIGMTCGGVVRILFEGFFPERWTIAVFGAGHVAQALIPVLLTLACQVICCDPRPEWLAKLPEHPQLEKRLSPQPADQVPTLPTGTFLLSLTMGHAHDRPILEAALMRQQHEPGAFAFLGVIGSQAKAGVLKRELRQNGICAELLQQLYCPIGLPLGGHDPAEIAISITAQLLQIRDQQPPQDR
jgi:xanthine dehydrogenase accessory factor